MRSIHYTILFSAILLFAGCASTPEEYIVGDWKFGHAETNEVFAPGDSAFAAITLQVIEKQYQHAMMEFHSDGTYIMNLGGLPESDKGTFWLEDQGKTLVVKSKFGREDRVEISRLSGDELVLAFDGRTLVMVPD